MGRQSVSIIAIALVLASALGLAACGAGDDELLPGATAREINSNLDQVEELAAAGDCVGAADAAEQVGTQVEALQGVDAKLKRALGQGAARLREVVATCEEATSEEPETEEEAFEPSEEEETVEKKPKKRKPKSEAEAPETEETEVSPSLPPQANGKAKGHEKQTEPPPAESGGGTETPGGISPSEPAGGD